MMTTVFPSTTSAVVALLATLGAVSGQCITQTTELSQLRYEAIYASIEVGLTPERGQDRLERSDLVGGIVRLAFHDAGEFDRNAADDLGVDGCVDLAHADNNGLAEIIATLDTIWAPNCDVISKADFWVLAGKVAAETRAAEANAGYDIPFRFGRTTAASCSYDGGRLPGAEHGVEEIERVFVDAMGLTVRDAVALLGAHTLGRAAAENSGYEGPWTTNPDVFDNQYFVTLTQVGWTKAVIDADHTTWVRGGTMFLNADMELAYHVSDEVTGLIRCGPVNSEPSRNGDRCLDNTNINSHAVEFGNNESAWLAAYAEAYQKMSEVGYSEGSLCSPGEGVCGVDSTTSTPTTPAPVTSAPATSAPASAVPTAAPTANPTPTPTANPTTNPTGVPTATPTATPTANPTTHPTTATPTTASPTTNMPTPSTDAPSTTSPTQSPTSVDEDCTNYDSLCSIWAALGYCDDGDVDVYMSEHCPLACQACPDVELPTPPRNDEVTASTTAAAATTTAVPATAAPVSSAPTTDGPTTVSPTTKVPTTAPPAPTDPPTQPADVCHFTACGAAGRCSETAFCTTHEMQHEVRCCSDTAKDGWTQRTDSCPWTESNNFATGATVCLHSQTFDQANDFCASVDARLCTVAEADDDCLRGTGCGHDADLIWTSGEGTTAGSVLAMNRIETTTDEPSISTEEEGEPGGSSDASTSDSDGGTSGGAIAGAILGTLAVVAVLAGILYVRSTRHAQTPPKAIENGASGSTQRVSHTGLDVNDESTDEIFKLAPDGGSIRLESVTRGNPMYRNSIVE